MEKTAGMVDVIKNNAKQNYLFQDKIVLTKEINNFRIKSETRLVEFLINRDLSVEEKFFNFNVVKKLYPESVKNFLNALKQGYPFNPFEVFLNYEITLNENCYFSYYFDTYTFTGGAHGNTIRKAKSYSLKTGRALQLQSFFKNGAGFKRQVLDIILKQAEQNFEDNPNIYFEDYKSLMIKNFNAQNFYLTPQGIVIFYNQYEIAPYVTGIPEFLIPYSETSFVPNC